MRRRIGLISFVVALVLAGGVPAHEGHQHNVMGTVAAIDGKQIEVTTKDETRVTVLLDAGTKYFRGKSEGSAADVKVGERVVIEAVEKAGAMVARSVRLAGNK